MKINRKNLKPTPYDKNLKNEIIALLNSDGHPDWAEMAKTFNFLSNPGPDNTAALVLGTDNILFNDVGIERKCWSPIIRHEIFHALADHYREAGKEYMRMIGENPDNYDEVYIQKRVREIYSKKFRKYNLVNIIGDLDMEEMYSEQDKKVLANFVLNGKSICGAILVDTWNGFTGDPKWVSKWDDLRAKIHNGEEVTFREIFRLVYAEYEEFEENMKNNPNSQKGDPDKNDDTDNNNNKGENGPKQPPLKLTLQRGFLVSNDKFVDTNQNEVQGDDKHIYVDIQTKKWYMYDPAIEEYVDLEDSEDGEDGEKREVEIIDPENPKGKRRTVLDGKFIDSHTVHDGNGEPYRMVRR